MKPKAMIRGATAPAEPIQRNTLSLETEPGTPSQPIDLSPEQTLDHAAATTRILNAILEEEPNYYVHHWGINE